MDLGVGKMKFIFCGKYPLPVTRIQVSDPGYKSPLVFEKSQQMTTKACHQHAKS